MARLSGDELIFAKRMLPHFMSGKTPMEAANAVMQDDARLLMAAFDRGHSQYFPTADGCGTSRHSGARIGDVIASHVSAAVYARLTPA